jgi:pimeloyl-ACP methyl ester carboxylesterase
VNLRKTLEAWPVLRQLRGADRLGLGEAARSPRSARLAPRTADADKVVPIDASARRSVELVKDATLKVYPGAPHGLFATHKEQFNADLLDFIRA